MGVTNTPNYNLIKPNIYEEFDAWGTHLNANADTIDGTLKINADAIAALQALAATKAPIDDPTFTTGITVNGAASATSFSLPSGAIFEDIGDFTVITFDPNDGLAYDRVNDVFSITISGVTTLESRADGIWSPEILFGTMDAVLGDDAQGAWLSFIINDDEIYYNKSLRTMSFYLNGVDAMTIGDLAIDAGVPIKGVAPTAAEHLTRKDYVDAEVDAVSQAASVTVAGGSTLALTHQNKSVRVTSPGNITVPPNSSVAFPVGARLNVGNWSTGVVTIAPGSGVTLRSADGKLALDAQYKGATLEKIGTNEWWIVGSLA